MRPGDGAIEAIHEQAPVGEAGEAVAQLTPVEAGEEVGVAQRQGAEVPKGPTTQRRLRTASTPLGAPGHHEAAEVLVGHGERVDVELDRAQGTHERHTLLVEVADGHARGTSASEELAPPARGLDPRHDVGGSSRLDRRRRDVAGPRCPTDHIGFDDHRHELRAEHVEGGATERLGHRIDRPGAGERRSELQHRSHGVVARVARRVECHRSHIGTDGRTLRYRSRPRLGSEGLRPLEMTTMPQLRPSRVVALLVALVLVVSACSSEPPAVIVSGNDPATSDKDIIETLEANGYTVFAALLERAGLTEMLTDSEGDETYTVFAPPDSAFADLGAGVDTVLMGEEDVIVVPLSDAAAAAGVGEEGEEADEGEDAVAESGPENAVPAIDTSQTATGEVSTGTIDQDAASPGPEETSDLLTAILEYHIVEGTVLAADIAGASTFSTVEGQSLTVGSREEEPTEEGGEPTEVITIDDVDVSSADLFATNGVIHTIEGVLLPEDRVEEFRELVQSIPVATDVMSTLRLTREHDQLVAAIEAAGLEPALSQAAAITVFAPTDEAFAGLSDEQRAALEDPDVLRQVLRYHAVSRAIGQEDVLNSESVQTLADERVTITKDGDTYTVNDVTIDRQIPATNGFVHVIDQILVPESAQGPGGL